MKITIIGGTGYVGLVTGVGFAALGHKVCCADIDEEKVSRVKRGIMPIYEKGLEELVVKGLEAENLEFTTDIKHAVQFGEIIFITVGTPEKADGSVDIRYLIRAAQDIGEYMNDYKIIVNKSTVPVGTGDLVEDIIRQESKSRNFDVVSNPEFLREGTSVQDFFNPDRIVIGAESEAAVSFIKPIFQSFKDIPLIITDRRSAEIIKYAANTFLAARLSFINEVSELCGKAGADVQKVVEALGYDKRIGKSYLNPGLGYGGPCLVKDIKAFINTFEEYDCSSTVLQAVYKRNEDQMDNVMKQIFKILGDVKGKTASILGLAFKPGTSDVRNSPALKLIKRLQLAGMKIKAYDPKVKTLYEEYGGPVGHRENLYEACKDADIAIITTEWEEFKSIDFNRLGLLMKKRNLFDGRNIFSVDDMENTGFNYFSIGRKSIDLEAGDEYMKVAL